ncbi:hypothetical protein IDG97_02275 [Pelagibacterales bacterium SAG-MED18]|nr:hypothetical protein [Pelagibacterales bacterium SAG-MED18]
MVKKTTIGLIQTKVFDNQNKNIENSVIKIKEAAKKKAKIICLPELFLSPYFCQSENHAKFKLAEKIPGRLSDIYCKLAKELSVVLMISLFEKKTTGFYHNTSIVIDDKGKIMLTGYGNIPTAVAAIKEGAIDYLAKPADAEDVEKALLADPSKKAAPPENPMSADRVKWEHIHRVFELCNRNVSETARRLKMHRRTLQRILSKRSPR